MNALLWVLQVLLALIFLFSGGFKLIASYEMMTRNAPFILPDMFLRFIGACEVLGALGLLLPGALRIKPQLTILAALGLAIITAGATVLTIASGKASMAIVPCVVCVLSTYVGWARWRVAPFGR